MNTKKLLWLSLLVSAVVGASTAVAAPRMARSGMMRPMGPTREPNVLHPGMVTNSASPRLSSNNLGHAHFNHFRRFNDGDHDFDDRHRRFNEIIIFDDFGFPFFYPYPYDYYYPYGYYSYNQPAYGSGYPRTSIVAEVQDRLAQAGYYHGAIDGVSGRRTRAAIRAYERAHNLPIDGAISRRLLGTMGLRY